MLNKALTVTILSLAVLLSSFIAFFHQPIQPSANTDEIEWLSSPKAVKQFNLISADGRFTNEDLHERWTIMVFGFISCPDICPTSLFELSQIASVLEQQNPTKVNYVFVSIDPQRDSIDKIAQYVSYFHPEFIGLTGKIGELRNLTKSIGIRFSASEFSGNYTVSHSVYFSIFAPDGKLHARFKPNFAVKKIATELNDQMTR